MPLPQFWLQTFLGASLWGGGLMVVGYVLGSQWESVARQAKKVDLLIAVVIVVVVVAVAVRFWLRRRRQEQRPT